MRLKGCRATSCNVIRSTLVGVARSLLRQVSFRVSADGLFEQPGERAPTPPLPTAPKSPHTPIPEAAVSSDPLPGPRSNVEPSLDASPPVSRPVASRPADGCVPVGVPGLKAALTPGHTALVVNHWATWCDPCVDELPRLVRAAAGLGNSAEFIGVSWDLFDHPGAPAKVAAKVAAFASSSGVGFASVLFTGTPAELFSACGLDVELVPQTIVLAPDGTVCWHKKGMITDDDVFPLIAAATAASMTGGAGRATSTIGGGARATSTIGGAGK